MERYMEISCLRMAMAYNLEVGITIGSPVLSVVKCCQVGTVQLTR